MGQGGMGEVFLAKIHGAAGFEKPCIIKTVLPTLLKDRQFVDRFHHEAKVLVHLVHSSIAQVYDMGEADGTYFMALEYVAGVDLAFLLEQARTRGVPVPVPVALFIGQRMAEGLGYAHRKAGPDGAPLGIVHRDVSPHNVMVSYEGDVKVIDFGLAKSAARSKYTLPSTVMGKLGYMSPEQVRAEALDHRSDIYSCGVVLWEMLAGRPLIRHGTVGEMMAAMSQPVVPELPGVRPDVDAALDAVVRRALTAKPDERYARSDELVRALTGELLRLNATVGAEEVGQFVRTLCPEAFEAQRQLIAKVTSASGHRRTPAPGIGYGTGQQSLMPGAPVSGFEPTMMRTLGDAQPVASEGGAPSSTVHVEGQEAPEVLRPSRPVPPAARQEALETLASRKRPMGLYAAIAVLLVIATAATTALLVRQPVAPVAPVVAVAPAPAASPGGQGTGGPSAARPAADTVAQGSAGAGSAPAGTASAGPAPAGSAGARPASAGSTGASAPAAGSAGAGPAPARTASVGPAAGATAQAAAGTAVVRATAQGTQGAAAVPSGGSVSPDDEEKPSTTKTPPKKKTPAPPPQPARYVSPTTVLPIHTKNGRVYVDRALQAGLIVGMEVDVVGPQKNGKRPVWGTATVVRQKASLRAAPVPQRMFLELDAALLDAEGPLFVAAPERVAAAPEAPPVEVVAPSVPDASTPKPEATILYGHAKKQGGVGGFLSEGVTVRNLSTQDWTDCRVVKDRRMVAWLGILKSDQERTVTKFALNAKYSVDSGMVGVFCEEGYFTKKLE
ncbi:MAG TPA: protein kinase [Myxococcus sp.]|nr:protein kinase [Myxococcus sp.]